MKSLDLEAYRSVLEHAPAMIWSADADACCDHVNAAWLAFTGRALDDELGAGWQADLHPDDRERFLTLYAEHVARREGFETQCRLRRHDGAYRTVVVRGAPRGDAAGFVGSCSENADTQSGSAFFEISLDHLCVAGFDGYWKRLNPSWTRTLGWTPDELMSRPLIEFVHPEDREATLSSRRPLWVGEPLLTFANRYRCKDGSYRWFEWRSVSDVDLELVYAIARDVTEDHEARRVQRELSESLAAILNSIADGVIATKVDATVARINPVAETLTGWTAAEAVGRPLAEVLEIVRADTHARVRLPLERTLQEGLASEGREHTLLVARDGSELPVAFCRAPMKDADGQLGGAVIVLRDMTAERQARADQDRLQRQLMIADRMASVGTLAAGVAHEINNPLACSMLNLEMIVEELESVDDESLPARRREWAEMATEARNGAERIRKLVLGLHTFSRSKEERRAVLDVGSVIDLAIDLASNEIRHRGQLVKDYGKTPLVEADESRLGQVLVNLLVNGAHALPERASVTSEIRVVTSTDATGNAVIEVSDTGPGIPADVIDRIFDPFFTTKAVGCGTGLGLSICHNVVSDMGGRITASNREGGGAVFRITLPPAAKAPEPPAAIAPERATAPRRAAILVVDDERSIGVSLGRVLRGHDVTTTTSAREALALVDAGSSFDLIISDLMMPEMSGMELYGELAERSPRAAQRMVFITGGAFTAAAHAFLESVPNERLAKPFEPAEVRALVERFID